MEEDIRIRKILIKIGISSHLQGYHYILEAIKILKKQKIHTNMTTIYEMIYKKADATSKCAVERAIRHSIEQAYKKGKVINKIYGEIPDNIAFLYDLVFNIDVIEEECFK